MAIVRTIQQPAQFQYIIFCPACKCGHGLRVGQPDGPNWTFNGDMEKPTFNPSLKTWGVKCPENPEKGPDGKYLTDASGRVLGAKDWVCHSFIKDGNIQFCGDSTHELAGQTVPLEDF